MKQADIVNTRENGMRFALCKDRLLAAQVDNAHLRIGDAIDAAIGQNVLQLLDGVIPPRASCRERGILTVLRCGIGTLHCFRGCLWTENAHAQQDWLTFLLG